MTKPQIWVATFLALFILLFLLQRATKKELENPTSKMNTMPQTSMSSENVTGKDLVARIGCVGCHGSNLAGTIKGPSLVGVSQFWSRDQLINYLRNPNSFMSSERFQNYKVKYPNVIMPSYSNIDVKDLGKIAEYLLELR